MSESLPLPIQVIGSFDPNGIVITDATSVGLGNVTNESKTTILDNAILTGITQIENIVQEVKEYTGVGPHVIDVDGKQTNIITHNANSSIILPLSPINGTTYMIINYGDFTVEILAQAPNTISFLSVGAPLELFSKLDKATMLYINDIWNLI
jgi:hypothetical protein